MSAGPAALMPVGARRPAALAVTAALHVVLAAVFMLRQADRAPQPTAKWIEVVPLTPARISQSSPPAPVTRKPRQRVAAPVRPLAITPPAPALSPVQEAIPDIVFPDAAPALPNAFELARASAGSVDKELRKQFPERRAAPRAKPLTEQQKLANGIARAVRPPKFYEPARITVIQDQGVGWGRRIEKVQTAFGTYCITQESNHGGDGRDPFTNARELKARSCPREE